MVNKAPITGKLMGWVGLNEGAGGREAYQRPPADYARRFLAGDDGVRAHPGALLEVGLGFDAYRRRKRSGPRFLADGAPHARGDRSAARRVPPYVRP